jgi:hypothetical protein
LQRKGIAKESFAVIYMKTLKYIVAAVIFINSSLINTFSQNQNVRFDETLNYNITYEVSDFEVDTVVSVKILDVQEIAGIAFLVIQKDGEFGPYGTTTTDSKGYILFSTVKAILPINQRGSGPAGIIPSKEVLNSKDK